MKIGSFITPERVGALGDAGADYAELFATRTFMVGDRDEFDAFRKAASTWRTPPRAFSGLLPGILRICGPDVEERKQDEYLQELFHRAGVLAEGEPTVATVGSADSRAVPAGFDRDEARDQIADFLTRASAHASENGIVLTLEHLNRGESNIFNTLRECGEFLMERDLDGVRLTADLYHMMEEAEPLSHIDDFAHLIVHAHVADTGRDAPGTGDYPFVEFLTKLHASGYEGNCSIEAFWTDFDAHVDLAVETCRKAATAAGYHITTAK